jgi:hypothetical protein
MATQKELKAKALERLVSDSVPVAKGNMAKDRGFAPDMRNAYAGVTVGWLSTVFDMNPETIKKRLKRCPILKYDKRTPVYELKRAAEYMVEPKFDVEEYMKTIRIEDLPVKLQETYWSAILKRQKYKLEAGDLWHTEDVMEVLGDTFQKIKFTIQLWADNIERETGLNEKQRTILLRNTDGLQDEIYKMLAEMSKNTKTKSVLGKLEEQEEADALGGKFKDVF